MFYKLMNNDIVMDLLKEIHYIRYLPKSKRWVLTDSFSAQGVMGSDYETIYYLEDKANTAEEKHIKVRVEKINEKEYYRLAEEVALRKKENENLYNEISNLKNQLDQQNILLQQILAKL